VLAGHRGRFILLIVLAFVTSATATHADPHTRPRTIPVYIFAGQSNMVGASAAADDLPSLAPELTAPMNDALFFGPTEDHASRWASLQPPTEIAGSSYGPGFGPELSAAAALASPDVPIAIVKYAHDGTDLFHDWDPTRTDGLYAAMLARVRTALASLKTTTHAEPRIAAFFWMQGEGDSYTRRHATDYEAHLTAFLADVRHDLGVPRLRVVLGHIAPVVSGAYAGIVRTAQERVAARDRDTTLIETEDLDHDPSSLVHLNSSGEIELGRRFARALQAMGS
jgi:carbohydrate esterase-like sialic acid-specific acetylesterase